MSDRQPDDHQPAPPPVPEDADGDVVASAPPADALQVAGISPRAWRYGPDAWRWNRRLTRRYVNFMLRVRSANALPDASRARFRAMGLPDEAIASTLSSIHSLMEWPQAWVQTAQRFLGDSRRQVSARNLPEAARARYHAALCFHAAQIYVEDDVKTVRTCRAAAASLFGQAQPYLFPHFIRLSIPWRTTELPAYLVTPEPVTRPVPMAVILNGFTTAKEESLGWVDEFLQAGIAVLAIDSPGTGEATPITGFSLDHDDLSDGIMAFAQAEPMIDATQVAMVGVSLGGAQAIACAAYDRRLLTAIAVTPPYQPSRWLHRANVLLLDQLSSITNLSQRNLQATAAEYDLAGRADHVHCPVLVIGAGRDVIVPPTESQHLAARLGPLGTLVWYEQGGHCLYEHISSWTSEAAEWIHLVAAARGETRTWSTQVDHAAEVGALARTHLEQFSAATPAPPVVEPEPEPEPNFDDPDLYPATEPHAAPAPPPASTEKPE